MSLMSDELPLAFPCLPSLVVDPSFLGGSLEVASSLELPLLEPSFVVLVV